MVILCHYSLGTDKTTALGSFLQSLLSLSMIAVDLFFVTSGFLLTGILLENREAPNLFRVFYLRRACRILPLYYLLLVFYILLKAGLSSLIHYPEALLKSNYSVFYNFFFVQNFWMAALGSFHPQILAVTWSLALEEQFYLILPFLVRKFDFKTLACVLAVIIFAAPLLRILTIARNFLNFPDKYMGMYVSLPFRMDTLFAGSMAALLVKRTRILDFVFCHKKWLSLYLLFFSVFFIWLSLKSEHFSSTFIFPFGFSLFPFSCIVALLLSLVDPNGLTRIFKNRLLRHFGKHSYFLYLFHNPVMAILHAIFFAGAIPSIHDGPTLLVTVVSFFILWALSIPAWNYLESPAIRFAKSVSFQPAKAAL